MSGDTTPIFSKLGDDPEEAEVLEAFVEDPDRPLSALPLPAKTERRAAPVAAARGERLASDGDRRGPRVGAGARGDPQIVQAS